MKPKDKNSPNKIVNAKKDKIDINNNDNQINKKINIVKSERKNDKLLDTIKEFADNLNKYVDQHNSVQKINSYINNMTLPFSLQTFATNNGTLNSEECPKDNIRNKNKNNNSENTIISKETIYSSFEENDEFKIIDNNEKENKNENVNQLSISSFNNKDIVASIFVSKDIANINSSKINSIIQNHKNLKILKNKDNNEHPNNQNIKNENKENDKEKK